MAKVIALSDARAMSLPGRRAREIVGARAGASSSTIRMVEIEPEQAGVPKRGPHVHHGFEECIHVLAGEGVTRTDDGEHRVAVGDTILVPSEQRHATYNTGRDILRLLCFFPVSDIEPATVEFASWDVEGES